MFKDRIDQFILNYNAMTVLVIACKDKIVVQDNKLTFT